jgi:hypothetical protein
MCNLYSIATNQAASPHCFASPTDTSATSHRCPACFPTILRRSSATQTQDGVDAVGHAAATSHRRAASHAPLTPAVGQNTGSFRSAPVSSCACKNIPLYRNSELAYVLPIPAHQEGRSCVVTVASRACGGRGSVGRERPRAGRIALREPKTSCRMSGAVRFVSSVSFRLRRQGWKNCGEMAGRAYGKTVWSWPSLLRSSALRMRQSRQPARCW